MREVVSMDVVGVRKNELERHKLATFQIRVSTFHIKPSVQRTVVSHSSLGPTCIIRRMDMPSELNKADLLLQRLCSYLGSLTSCLPINNLHGAGPIGELPYRR